MSRERSRSPPYAGDAGNARSAFLLQVLEAQRQAQRLLTVLMELEVAARGANLETRQSCDVEQTSYTTPDRRPSAFLGGSLLWSLEHGSSAERTRRFTNTPLLYEDQRAP